MRVLIFCFLLAMAVVQLPMAAFAADAGARAAPWWLWLLVPAVIAVLYLLGVLLHLAARLCTERLKASNTARLLELMSSLAEGAAETLLAHPPAPATSIAAVRNGLVAAGVAYARAKMPDTIKAIGIDDPTIAARLDRAIGGKLVSSGTLAAGLTALDVAVSAEATPAQGAQVAGAVAAEVAPAVVGATEAALAGAGSTAG